MRIHRLEVEGFRSLKKISWEPGALNVVIGPNGSGKSNLLKSLILLATCSVETGLAKYIKKIGGIPNLTWDQQTDNMTFHLSLNRETKDDLINLIHYNILLFTPSYEHYFYIEKESLSSSTYHINSKSDVDNNYDFIRHQRQATHYSPEYEEHTKDIEPRDEVEPILSTPWPGSRNKHSSREYLKYFAIFESFTTGHGSPVRMPAITSFEKKLDIDGSNLIQVLHTLYTSDRNFESDIDSAMNAAFGNDYEKLVFPPASDQRVQLRIRWKSLKREQSALDISDGTLRFLYLMAILANPEPSPLIAIDEPETGLHPSMFPIIAEFAAEASKKSQIIFTTHSDQFLTACQEFDPTVTVASWSDGETHLKVVDKEQLKGWLAHYSLGSLFRSGELEELL